MRRIRGAVKWNGEMARFVNPQIKALRSAGRRQLCKINHSINQSPTCLHGTHPEPLNAAVKLTAQITSTSAPTGEAAAATGLLEETQHNLNSQTRAAVPPPLSCWELGIGLVCTEPCSPGVGILWAQKLWKWSEL